MGRTTLFSCVLLVVASAAGTVLPEGQPAKDIEYYEDHLRLQRAAPKCMDDLGCFPITEDFFHPLYRPINLTPADREKINTKFLMYSKANPKQSYPIRAKNVRLLKASGFDANKKTKVIVHGYIDNQFFGEWMRQMKDEFLLNGDHNVIIVDWSGGNGLPYLQAAANTRVVGAEVAFMLNWLKDTQALNLSDVHVLGHSLGTHVAGYAGANLNKLGRITGMDPAEPLFQNLPASVRIDPTDADFVDVIHTDSVSFFPTLGLGMNQLVGHVDFFPNNGQKQPGCGTASSILKIFTSGVVEGVRRTVACNHQRAVDFAHDSINSHKCVPTAYACADWDTFLAGKCASCGPRGDRCAILGEKAPSHYLKLKNDTRQLKFYVQTSSKAPFCLFHYQVTLRLAIDKDSSDQKGSLKLSLEGSAKSGAVDLYLGGKGTSVQLHPGATYTFLVTTPEEVGDISSATLRWEAGSGGILGTIGGIFRGKKTITVNNIRILPMNGVDDKLRSSQTRSYCVSKRGPIKDKESVTFAKSDLC